MLVQDRLVRLLGPLVVPVAAGGAGLRFAADGEPDLGDVAEFQVPLVADALGIED